MQIKDMTTADIDAIMAIEIDSFKFPWSKNAMISECSNKIATYLVVYDDDELCGYGGYLAVENEAYITNIAIARDKRRKGYGTILLNSLLERAKTSGIDAITLEVRKSNIDAIRLYQRLNFVDVGIRPNFYPDNEDAIIFWLRLGGK